MTEPTYPPALIAALKPTREELRAVIAAIKLHPDRLDLWRKADAINRRQLDIERAYFFRKGVAA